MAGYARYTAVLDACVLYPIVVADALLSLAYEGMYAAKWTRQIESEFVSALERERPDLRGRLHRRQQFMRASIPDWEVEQDAWEHIVPSLQLPDPTDRHVLAAALAAHADCVVTSNKRHFPDQVVRPLAIEVIDPDTFMVNQLDLNEVTALTAFREMRRRKRNPSLTAEELCSRFERAGLRETAQRLRGAISLI